MNRASVNFTGVLPPAWSSRLCEYAVKVSAEIKLDNWELSFLLCDDETIRKLNKQYRGRDETTDVLSFNLGGQVRERKKTVFYAGDIVISLDTLHENSNYYKISEDEELRRLIIHGILHLDGMDHGTDSNDEPMLILQENILKKLDQTKIIPWGGEYQCSRGDI
jgi:probable rRNA maturation factor